MGTSIERTEGISIVDVGEDVTTEDEIGKGGRVGKSEWFGDGVCSGSQSLARSVERRREVDPGVATL